MAIQKADMLKCLLRTSMLTKAGNPSGVFDQVEKIKAIATEKGYEDILDVINEEIDSVG